MQVKHYLQELDHPLIKVVRELRNIILSVDTSIAEQIKWNSLAFYYTGEMKAFDAKEYRRDLLVLNLHRPNEILLVFPTGASIPNRSGLLDGKFKDSRKTVAFNSMEEVKAKEKDLIEVIRDWLAQVEK